MLTGYCRPYVKANVGTRLVATDACRKMNCTQQYISKMLKGQKNMSLETICKIENTLGFEIIKGLDESEQ